MTDGAPIRVEQRGPIAVWTMDREAVRNALSRAMLLELGRLAREVAASPTVRAVVLTGAGDRAFCAGADLKERATMNDGDVLDQIGLYRSELGALDHCSKPVVAALNGVALGGGLELALCCDLRTAASHAELALPETSLGIIPGAGGTQRLPRLVGEARAKEMILLGRRIGADEAQAWGLVNRVAPKGADVVADAIAWIAPIADGAPIAQAAALDAIDRGRDVALDAGLAFEKASYEKTLGTEDRREALAAFAAKRKAQFQGK